MKHTYTIFDDWNFSTVTDMGVNSPSPLSMLISLPKRVMFMGGLGSTTDGVSTAGVPINKISWMGRTANITQTNQIDFSSVQTLPDVTLAHGLAGATTALFKNNVYLMGGYEAGPTPDSYYSPTDKVIKLNLDLANGNVNESGIVSQAVIDEIQLPHLLARPASVVTRSRMLLLGGHGVYSEVFDDIISSNVTSSGRLSAWKTVGRLPRPIVGGQAFVMGDYIYLLGGALSINSDNSLNTEVPNPPFVIPNLNIYRSLLNNRGLPTSWENVGTLTAPFFGGRLLTFRNTVVLLGGSHTPYVQSYRFNNYGQFLANHHFIPGPGVVDPALADAATAYNGPLYDFNMMVQGSVLYAFGGVHRPGVDALNTTVMAKNFFSLIDGTQTSAVDPAESLYHHTKNLGVVQGRFHIPNKADSSKRFDANETDIEQYIAY